MSIDTRTQEAPEAQTRRSPRLAAGPWHTLGVMVAALLLGALLNARPLSETAAAQPLGWQRDLAIGVTDRLIDVSEALGLDRPHEWADEALDQAGEPHTLPQDPAGVFVPTAERRAQLLVAGDSLTDTVGPAVVNQAAATGLIEAKLEVRYSSGLTRPEMFDWPARLAAEVTDRRVDIVVFMVGANDGQPIQTPSGWASFTSPEWKVEYAGRVGNIMDLLTERVATLYWVGQPIPRDDVQAFRVSAMNTIYQAAAEDRPAVRFVDSWRMFADADGNYSPELPDPTGRMLQVRDPDGVHLTAAGADLLAGEILATIAEDWNFGAAD